MPFCKLKKWHRVEIWLRKIMDGNFKNTDIEKIFGTNKLVVAVQKAIYIDRQEGRPYNLSHVKRVLDTQLCLEEYHAETKNNIDRFMLIWTNS